MILYYSGTGNSKYTAGKIADTTGQQLTDLNRLIKSNDHSPLHSEDGNLILCVPTYAWRIPKIVEKFITESGIEGAERIWYVMTCGDGIGKADIYNRKLSDKLGLVHMGTLQVIMPENYVAMFAVPKPETALKIIKKSEPVIDKGISAIRSGVPFPSHKTGLMDAIYSDIVNPVFYRMFVKADAFTADSRCTGCGKCVKVCPLNNIYLASDQASGTALPVWGNNCTHCMACICGCPSEAIEYGKKSIGKPRYINPFS
ncbi:MAG: EFR1 family ferrodoxin [Parasporobacterium sp.]|nr:EFR1 family ferrodoxin [Parasporobacterium sp.]